MDDIIDSVLDGDDEISEAELLEEIAQETKIQQETLLANGPEVPGMALSPFQETILTTGSGVANATLLCLFVLFLIRGIQLLYNAMTKMSALQEIKSVLSEAKTVAAHKVRDVFYKNSGENSENHIITYCAPFELRYEYEDLLETEPHNKEKLKKMLVLRAKEFMKRTRIIDQDRTGMMKSFQMDMVPMKVWKDFQQAQAELESESRLIIFENQRHQFSYGKNFKNNIFMFADSELQEERRRGERYRTLRAKRDQRAEARAPKKLRNAAKASNSSGESTESLTGPPVASKMGGVRRRRPKKRFTRK